ncbi:DUF3298 domain-containing protein [Paradevosia shaoguanensis]|uniref:DUF3298 domain-containing protein n=1 Tax=Paradevosia shaoguanensis TaxID=1335043 RepID=UPI003C725439
MLLRIMFALAMFVLAAPAAQAASFDCAKASTPFEKAICSDPALSAQDEVLAVAYQTAVGGLSKAATDAMLKGQRDWLGFIGKVCADDMLPGQEKIADERVACLSSQYITRIRSLEGSRMLGGLRFYLADTFWSAPDPEGESYYKIATDTTSAVQLDGKGAEAKGFNAMVNAELASGTKTDSSEDNEGESRTSSDHDLSLTVSHVSDARIDVEVSTYWFGHGAAHGNYGITYLHFLRGEGRPLQASDIFTGKKWVTPVADLVLKRLKDDRGELLWDIEQSWLEEVVADTSRWNITDNGLVIQFQPYEVASYADGAVTAEISWQQLSDYMTEGATSLIY